VLLALAASLPLSPLAAQVMPPQGARPAGAPAMQASGSVRGTVLNAADGAPIASASVAIYSARDSSLVTGALSGADGSVRIEGLRPGRYYARVSAVGYQTVTRGGLAIDPSALVAELGQVKLAVSAVALEGLSVTAEKRTVALAPDRNSYSVRDMPGTSGGTAVDVLRNVPAVEVDIDGKVSLRGNENVVVQINGRPTPMRGEQLGNFLAQLPADMLEKIEVVPNPSAKYDPEGMAGIVNIALRQNTDLGASGGITFGGGSTGRANASANFGYQKGALTLYSSYGFMRDERESTGFTYRENRYESPLTYLEQDSRGTTSPLSHNVTLSTDYKLGKRDALSSNLLFSTRSSERDNTNAYRELDAARATTSSYNRLTNGSGSEQNFDAALTYKHTVRPRMNEFSAEVRFNRSAEDDFDTFTQQTLSGTPSSGSFLARRETNGTDQLTRNFTLQSDYTRTFAERTRLETGYKGVLRKLDYDFDASLFSEDDNAFRPDLARSNEFGYEEQVHSAYGVLGHSVGKFDLQGGLRVEHAAARFDLTTTGETFKNDYNSLFPSALVAFNVDNDRQLKLSYSKRVERPRTRQLNPFTRYDDPLNLSRGNPYLKPEYTHAVELGFQQSGSLGTLQLSPFFRYTTDAVRRLTSVDENGVSTTTFKNIATSKSYGSDVTGSVRMGSLSGFAGVSAFQVVSDGSNVGTNISTNAFGWSSRANLTYRINRGMDVQGFYMYRAPMKMEQGRMSGHSMLNLSLRQKLMNDKASLTLRVVDPFDQMRFNSTTSDSRFYQQMDRKMRSRGLFASFSYNFGQAPRMRQRPNPQQDMPQEDPDMR
jgi:outer membrane receptor protein involved in Fe transport